MILPFLLASIIPTGQSFECSPTMVYDGDGPVWCAEGPRIRLAGIAAREMDGTCRSNQPCSPASATASLNQLVRLLGQPDGTWRGHVRLKNAPTLRCISTGPAVGNRTGAWCFSPISGDLSCAMVASGFAVKWDRYWKRHTC